MDFDQFDYKHALATCLAIIVLLYVVPVAFGFPLWPGGSHASLATIGPHTDDNLTFATGYRQVRIFIRNELMAGRLPLWMPYQMLGYPLLEQAEYQLLNPLEWLNWLWLSETWWTLVLILQLMIGAAGVVSYCRLARIGPVGAAAAAALYSCAGFTSHLYLTAAFVTAVPVIPWLLVFLSRLLGGKATPLAFAGFTLCCVLMFLNGQPQLTLCTFYFAAFYAVALSAVTYFQRDLSLATIIAGLALAVVAGAISVLISALQTGPFLQLQLSGTVTGNHMVGWWWPADAPRSVFNLFNFAFPYTVGLSPYQVWTMAPAVWRTPSEDMPIGFYASGALLLLLGLQQARRHPPLTNAAAVGLAIIAATIIAHGYLGLRVWPFGSVTLPRYSMPLFAFFGSVLAGTGLVSLRERAALLWAAGGILGLGALLVGYLAYNLQSGDVLAPRMIGHLAMLNAVSILSAGAIVAVALRAPAHIAPYAALVILSADVLWHFRYGLSARYDALRLFPWIALVTAAALLVWRPVWVRAGVATSVAMTLCLWSAHLLADVEPVVERPLPQLPEGQRIVGGIKELGPNRSAALGIMTMSSRYPIQFKAVQSRFANNLTDFRGFGTDGRPWPEYCEMRQTLGALAASIVVIESVHFAALTAERPDCVRGLSEIGRSDQFITFVDPRAAPRAEFIADAATATSVRVTDASPREVLVRVEGGPGRLILRDQHFPGWLAYVDGAPAVISSRNGLFREVAVGSQHADVRFVYEPDFSNWWRVTAAGVGACALCCALLHASARRRTRLA